LLIKVCSGQGAWILYVVLVYIHDSVRQRTWNSHSSVNDVFVVPVKHVQLPRP